MDRVTIIYDALQRQERPTLPREIFIKIKETYFLSVLHDMRKKYEMNLLPLPEHSELFIRTVRIRSMALKNVTVACMIKSFSEMHKPKILYSKQLNDYCEKYIELFQKQIDKILKIWDITTEPRIEWQSIAFMDLLTLYLDSCGEVGGFIYSVNPNWKVKVREGAYFYCFGNRLPVE